MFLKTPRLILRELRYEDEAALARYQSHPRYLDHYTEQPVASAIVSAAISWAGQRPRKNYQLAIALSEESPAIGCMGIRCEGQAAGTAEFGCELDPAFWGRGLAHEAAAALLDLAFGELGLSTLVASTARDNDRIHALLTKLRFVPEPDTEKSRWRRTRD